MRNIWLPILISLLLCSCAPIQARKYNLKIIVDKQEVTAEIIDLNKPGHAKFPDGSEITNDPIIKVPELIYKD